ncbi:hypothetical protein FRC06_007734 [Ceratobasidium sp. 370]|nr:hypothetical protein FRC06_007734 [Ceratobasidium sp. 370]
MSNGSEVEVVEETPAPPSRPSSSAIPKRKGRLPTVSAQASLEPAPSSKKSKGPAPNGNGSNTPRVDQAELDALRAENEALKSDLEKAVEVASKFQEDFNKLQNLRFSKPERDLSDYIAAAEERERLLMEQNQALMAQLPRLSEFLQPHPSGILTLLTREENDHKLSAQRNEIQNLRKTMEEQSKTIEELTQNVNSCQLQLEEEIKRSTALTAQLSERQPAARNTSNQDNAKHQLMIALYEDLTNFKIHSAKKFDSEELGKVTEFKCDCTTFGKTLFFRLELYQAPAPAPAEDDKLVDTVRFSPLGLEHEKDQAFLDGLAYLTDTFTFVKDGGPFDKQMWEFGVAVNKLMRQWREGGDEDEDEDEEEAEEEGAPITNIPLATRLSVSPKCAPAPTSISTTSCALARAA